MKAELVSVQLYYPSEEEDRDYDLDGIVDFVHPSGKFDLEAVYYVISEAMAEAGYQELTAGLGSGATIAAKEVTP